MLTQRFIALALAATIAAGLVGCNKSPNCADLNTVTDPAQRSELLDKCPRSGPEFKPSPKKSY